MKFCSATLKYLLHTLKATRFTKLDDKHFSNQVVEEASIANGEEYDVAGYSRKKPNKPVLDRTFRASGML